VKEDIIKLIVDMDYKARHKVEELQEEKDNLDVFLKASRKQLLKQYTQDTTEKIQAAMKEIDSDIKEKTIQIASEHEATLNRINQIYDEKRDEWIEDMYQFCIK
jgi:hypothetical protein